MPLPSGWAGPTGSWLLSQSSHSVAEVGVSGCTPNLGPSLHLEEASKQGQWLQACQREPATEGVDRPLAGGGPQGGWVPWTLSASPASCHQGLSARAPTGTFITHSCAVLGPTDCGKPIWLQEVLSPSHSPTRPPHSPSPPDTHILFSAGEAACEVGWWWGVGGGID